MIKYTIIVVGQSGRFGGPWFGSTGCDQPCTSTLRVWPARVDQGLKSRNGWKWRREKTKETPQKMHLKLAVSCFCCCFLFYFAVRYRTSPLLLSSKAWFMVVLLYSHCKRIELNLIPSLNILSPFANSHFSITSNYNNILPTWTSYRHHHHHQVY